MQREVQSPELLQWQYIAPTMAAILKPERPKVVAFRRTLQIPPDQAVYPAAPPTGPPLTAWLAAAYRRVSQRRRIQRLADQPAYPATPVTPSNARQAVATFETRLQRGRRRLVPPDVVGVGAAAPPAVTPYLDAPRPQRRLKTNRRLAVLPLHLTFPATPEPPANVEFAAIVTPPRRRRSGRPGLFLSAGGSTLSVPSAATPALYPSYLPVGFYARRDTERRLVRVLDAPVYPITPPPSASNARALTPAFETRLARGRRALLAPSVLGVAAAPPPEPSVSDITAVTRTRLLRRRGRQGLFLTANTGALSIPQGTTPAVYPSFVPTGYLLRRETDRRLLLPPPVVGVDPAEPPGTSQAPITAVVAARSIRRRGRAGLFLGGGTWVHGVGQPEAAWRLPKTLRRAATARRALALPALLERPQTPPVAPQPEPAFRLKLALRMAPLGRVLQPAAPQLERPETPPVIVVQPLGGDDKPDARKYPGWDKKRSTLKRSQELRLEEDIRAIYRRLTSEPTTAARAAEIVATVAPSVPSEQLLRELARRSIAADQTAVEIEIALRLLLAELEEAQDNEDAAVLAMLLAQVL